MDAIWTKFLKIWIGIPVGSNNAYLYQYTNKMALSTWFDEALFDKCWFNMHLPHLKGFIFVKPNFLGRNCPNIQQIPSYMWFNLTSFGPPNKKEFRNKIAKKIFGWSHSEWCRTEDKNVRKN